MIGIALALTACDTAVATEVSREAARAAVRPVLAERLPGLPLEPATDCVIDNATGGELIAVATSSAARRTEDTARVVLDVARRPETIRCLATDGLPAILNTL